MNGTTSNAIVTKHSLKTNHTHKLIGGVVLLIVCVKKYPHIRTCLPKKERGRCRLYSNNNPTIINMLIVKIKKQPLSN